MKTIFITGSTDGIGKIAAMQLAQAGHQLILHGRNKAKLAGVVEEIKAASKNQSIAGFDADLSSLSATAQLGRDVVNEYDHLDILINNAGVYHSPQERTPDGLDIRFVVNYLAPIVLTRALKPALEKSDHPRIINLSSAAQAPVSISALEGNAPIGAQQAYAQSKLALTMWSFDLASSFNSAVVIALNPGSLLNTKMVQEAFGQYWSPAEKGADIIRKLALDDEYAGKSGTYFDNDAGSFNQAHPDAYDDAKIQALMAATNKMLA